VFENKDGAGDNYEVEYIHDHRNMAHGREYYIHWKGWPSSDDEWIHEDDMDLPDLIAEYLSSIPTWTSMHRTRGRGVQGQNVTPVAPGATPTILRVGFRRD